MKKDTQSRKWQLTINNPQKLGFTHDRLKEILSSLKLVYWCMSDEIGKEGTYHTHIYLQAKGGIRFSTVHNNFMGAHVELANGTALQNRDYLFKLGKWENDEKHGTQVPGTTEEWGEMPVERQGSRNDLADIYSMVKQGMTDYEIVEQVPDIMLNLDKIEIVRQAIRNAEFSEKWRDLEVTYIYGDTGAGKTRYVMEKYGYLNVYRVTDYTHPFDCYTGQDVVLFEEFRSSLKLSDMLKYLDGYPVVLPSRYLNKQACFTKVYIVTNISIDEQYPDSQDKNMGDFLAFLRRIDKVKRFSLEGIREYDILLRKDGFRVVTEGEVIPFENA